MIIQDSQVNMTAKSSFKATSKATYSRQVRPCIQFKGGAIIAGPDSNQTTDTGNGLEKEGDFLSSLNYFKDGKEATSQPQGVSGVSELSMDSASTKVKFQTLNWLLHLLFGEGKMGGDLRDVMEDLFQNSNSCLVTESCSYEYQESREVSFSSTGTAVTADGRQLEFGVSFSMSASFSASYSQCYQSIQERSLCDPLVINLDDNPTRISDQRFYFDLNCDGQEEEINQLEAGSGYLALDLNGDGIINDGSELFGPKSGDGFKDLSAYDTDGNGWIDEADEIFEKLRIWTMDASGKSELYTLKQADVGAICLKKIKTDYAYKDGENNLNGVLRNSGIYLSESTGRARIINHVDMAG